MAALVTHIGSGYEHEVEAAFTVLRVLVDESSKKMAPFALILKVQKTRTHMYIQ